MKERHLNKLIIISVFLLQGLFFLNSASAAEPIIYGINKYYSVNDGDGGAIIAWEDGETNNIYAKFISAEGISSDSVLISDRLYLLDFVSDNNKGAIALLGRFNKETKKEEIYINFLNSDRTLIFDSPIKIPEEKGGGALNPAIVADGSGGAIIIWQAYPDIKNVNIYGNFIDSGGSIRFPDESIEIVGNAFHPLIISDENGKFIISWVNEFSWQVEAGFFDLDLMMLSSFVITPFLVGPSNNYASFSRKIIADGEGGFVIAQPDYVDSPPISVLLAARIDAWGNAISDKVIISDKINFANELSKVDYSMRGNYNEKILSEAIVVSLCHLSKFSKCERDGIYAMIFNIEDFLNPVSPQATLVSADSYDPTSVGTKERDTLIFYKFENNLYAKLFTKEREVKDFIVKNTFIRGDIDNSKLLDLTDAISLLSYLFQAGKEPSCLDAADVDDSGILDLTDAIYLLQRLFQGGAEIPEPRTLGVDSTQDSLDCKCYGQSC